MSHYTHSSGLFFFFRRVESKERREERQRRGNWVEDLRKDKKEEGVRMSMLEWERWSRGKRDRVMVGIQKQERREEGWHKVTAVTLILSIHLHTHANTCTRSFYQQASFSFFFVPVFLSIRLKPLWLLLFGDRKPINLKLISPRCH